MGRGFLGAGGKTGAKKDKKRRDGCDRCDACDACEPCNGCGCDGFLTLSGVFLLTAGVSRRLPTRRATARPSGARAPEEPVAPNHGEAAPTPGASAVLAAIGWYRRQVSPRTRARCRYLPTCSAYGAEAVRRHGLEAGSRLTADRLRRCRCSVPAGTPDPVPPPGPGRHC